jgi:uncharacterized protein (TIGR02594 family)
MPSDGDKARIELEVALKDSISTALKTIGRELDAMNKKAMEIGQGPSAAYTKFKRENDNLTESAKRSNAQFVTMGAAFTNIGRSLIGPIGVVAGLYEAAKALDVFASGRLQIRNLSTDLHLSTSQLSIMQRTLANMGMSTQESTQVISNAMGKIKEAFTLRLGSQLMSDLREMGEGTWATKLQAVIDTGDFAKAWDMLLEKGNTGTARFKAWFSERMGIPESVIQSYKRNSEGVQAMTDADIATLENYHKKMNLITTKIEDAWHKLAITVIDAIKTMNNSKIADILRMEADIGTDPAKAKESLQDRLGKFGLGVKSDRYPQGEDPMGADYTRKSSSWKARGITDFGGRRRDDSIEIETDSNKMLRDIRDTLQRMEGGINIGGGSGGSAGTYGAGARSSGGALQATLGGFRAGGSGSRGDRNNNPGNLKFGAHAKAFGATHADAGGFAVFPDMASGNAAHETLLKSDKYSGLTLDQFGDKYAEGSASWKKTVGGALGIKGGDIVDNQSPALASAIRKAEGTTGIGSGGGVPSSIINEARKVVLAGGGAEAAKSYIQSKGYNVSSAWCGDFAASVVKGAGGTPPKDYKIASNWRNFGQPIEGDPQPGDIAVRRGARTGSTGSHVTIVDQFDPETGRFKGIGGNQGRMMSSFPRSGYDFRRGDVDEARERIDKTQSVAQRVDANMNASIDFKNMPSWVKSSVDDNGKFKELRVTRSAPQNAKAGDGISSSSPWSYE